VCYANEKNTILLPCRHNICCSECLARMDDCPICRTNVNSYMQKGEIVGLEEIEEV